MAIYHLTAQMIGRSDGRSSVAAAGYRSGEALLDERTGIECRYDRRRERIAHTEILAPAGSPAWATDRQSLWKAAEKRKDAQVAREFEVSLPVELTEQQRLELTRTWAREQLVAHGLVVDISHHRDRADRNPHAHIMATTRPIDSAGFGNKARHLNDRAQLDTWRASWAEHVNRALERAGHDERIDHRSLEAQGIDREPTIKEGYAARAIEQRSQRSQRAAENRAIRDRNAQQAARLRAAVVAIGKFIQGIGTGLLADLRRRRDLANERARTITRTISTPVVEPPITAPTPAPAPAPRQQSQAFEELRRQLLAKKAEAEAEKKKAEAEKAARTVTRTMSPPVVEPPPITAPTPAPAPAHRPMSPPVVEPPPPPAPGTSAAKIAGLKKQMGR